MNHVPVEILYFIFIQLELKDRLKCMFVCRLWHDTLGRRSLLYTLNISHKQFDGFKDMVERQSYRGTQVEELEIDINYDFDKRELCNMFPNLRVLELTNGGRQPTEQYMDKTFSFTCPPKKLERIKYFGECGLPCQLATLNSCNRLKVLELNFYSSSYPVIKDTISQLKNMPVLETLTLSSVTASLMDFETLHMNLPSIKELNLFKLALKSGEIPQNITPASLITKLHVRMKSAGDLQTRIEIYKYISKKYTSVDKPIHNDMDIGYEDIDYGRDVYTEGIIPMYRNIGPNIDSFHFHTFCNGMDAFTKFNEFDMKLKNLTIKSYDDDDDDDLFLEELAQSNQARYIQNLNLQDILPWPKTKLNDMTAVKTLDIDCNDSNNNPKYRDKKIIDFYQLVEACPVTLSWLSTDYVHFRFNKSTYWIFNQDYQ